MRIKSSPPPPLVFGVRWWVFGAFFGYLSGGGLHFCIYLDFNEVILGLVSR